MKSLVCFALMEPAFLRDIAAGDMSAHDEPWEQTERWQDRAGAVYRRIEASVRARLQPARDRKLGISAGARN